VDQPPLPGEGAQWNSAYGRFEALGQQPRAEEGGVVHGKFDGPLTQARASVRQPADGGGWWGHAPV
jgi:hypothetical protein